MTVTMDERTSHSPEDKLPAPSSSIEDVLKSEELARRASRPPDFEAENRALATLAQELAANPRGVLQQVVELALELCRADSAGVSILEAGGEHGSLRWHALAGAFVPYLNGTMPREASPCGEVIARNEVLLFSEAERYFPVLRGVDPPSYENLLAPWSLNGQPVGTLWLIAHTPEHQFDAEDARLLASLARFASAAWQTNLALRATESAREEAERRVAARTRDLEQSHAALRASEERHRLIVEGASDYAILTLSTDGRIESWSPGAEAVFGWRAEEVIGQSAAITFTLEDQGRGVPEQELVTAQEEGCCPDVRWHLHKDGSHVFIEGSTRLLKDESGAVRGFLKVGQDVTRRRQMEVALRESEAHFRHLAESVPDIVFTTTPDGIVEYVNPRREALTGQPPDNALGTPMWPDLIHPDDRARVEAQRDQAYAEHKPFEARYRLHTTSGAYRWFIMRARPIANDNGEVVRWYGTLSDIDALMRAEEALRQANEMLEVRVQERTQQVQQLTTSLTLAEQQERQRVSQVLHDDLQQLLYSQLMRLQRLRKHAAEQDNLALTAPLETIIEQLRQAVQVTRTLVTELNPPILATEGLSSALSWLAGHMQQMYGLRVQLEVKEPCEPRSEAIRTLIVQMTREVLFNVVKHAQTEEARLALEQQGGHLLVHVEDEGLGFEGQAVTAATHRRRGFGLWGIAERLELMGGWMRIEAVPHKGSRVTLAAPCETGQASQQSVA